MNNELRKIVEQRLKNAKANALAVGTETITGKMFTGKAELLESILEEYVALPIHNVSNTEGKLCEGICSTDWFGKCFKCGNQVFVREDSEA